jgi:hypothetical protein
VAQLISWLQTGWIGDMAPGDAHSWVAWGGLQPSDVISIMAHPVVGNPDAPERVLQVENVRAEGAPDGTRRIYWNVRNVGPNYISGYHKTYMMLRP